MASPQASIEDFFNQLSIWYGNFTRNTSEAFSNMTPQRWIRLVVIVGAYLLIRPYIMKLGAKIQEREHAKAAAAEIKDPGTKINANDLRGGKKTIALPGVDSSDEEDEAEAKPVAEAGWGRKARLRQRKFVRDTLEAHERKLEESKAEEEDKDIQEFLVD